MVATFKAVNRNWKESTDEATEEVQKAEKEKEKDTDDAFHPQDPVPGSESVSQEPEEKKISEMEGSTAVQAWGKLLQRKGLDDNIMDGSRCAKAWLRVVVSEVFYLSDL
jgi:hypothetical protein